MITARVIDSAGKPPRTLERKMQCQRGIICEDIRDSLNDRVGVKSEGIQSLAVVGPKTIEALLSKVGRARAVSVFAQ